MADGRLPLSAILPSLRTTSAMHMSPAIALAAGGVLSLSFGNPWPRQTATLGSRLLQVAVVALGFGISLESLVRAGTTGVGLTIVLLAVVFAAGIALGKWMA